MPVLAMEGGPMLTRSDGDHVTLRGLMESLVGIEKGIGIMRMGVGVGS